MTLIQFLQSPHSDHWHEQASEVFNELIGLRYKSITLGKDVQLRTPKLTFDSAPYLALIHSSNPKTGGYGGTSMVLSPSEDGQQILIGFGCGTNGIAPDEEVLGKPGHMRFVRSLAKQMAGHAGVFAWHKADPTLVDEKLKPFARTPDALVPFKPFWDKYQHVMYAVFVCHVNEIALTESVFLALLDQSIQMRGGSLLAGVKKQAAQVEAMVKSQYFVSPDALAAFNLLKVRQYLVLQGAPGTGKSHIAQQLLANAYAGNGMSIQFHPSFSYEQFVGGLAPTERNGQFGFVPRPGVLMQAVKAANASPAQPYLLHIDELNRADIARVLGESLYLLEPGASRTLSLAYDFGAPWGNALSLPDNLHILCTMNTNDRSIAALDLAIRRRFAFVTLWPQVGVVAAQNDVFITQAFNDLVSIFFELANEQSLALLPGHSYFLASSSDARRQKLQHELIPLLRHYLERGLLGECYEPIYAYVQWLESAQ